MDGKGWAAETDGETEKSYSFVVFFIYSLIK